MVQVPTFVIEEIKKFIQEALKENIHISQAVLFGSFAKGTNHEWSDIDLAVVSEDFEGIRFNDNVKLGKPRVRSSADLQTHPFRPEDFNTRNPFVAEILEYGIRVV